MGLPLPDDKILPVKGWMRGEPKPRRDIFGKEQWKIELGKPIYDKKFREEYKPTDFEIDTEYFNRKFSSAIKEQ